MHITSESFISIMAPLIELNHRENDMLIIIAILLFIIACGVAPQIIAGLIRLAAALVFFAVVFFLIYGMGVGLVDLYSS